MSAAHLPEQFLADLTTGRENAADNASDDNASQDDVLSDGASAFLTQTINSAAATDIYGHPMERPGTEEASDASDWGADVEVVAARQDVNVPPNHNTSVNQDNVDQGGREDTNTSRPHSYASVGFNGANLHGGGGRKWPSPSL